MASISLRPPTFSPAKAPADFQLPSISWLTETWHVTHSTLPMWKSKRNVRIQYTPLEPSSPSVPKDQTDRIDDLVSYQSLDGDKVSTVKGLDKAASNSRGEWDWRGKGWLKIAGSHWEVLGWGEEQETGNKWVVTMFAKTLFTPAGIDVYSRDGKGVQDDTLGQIKSALSSIQDDEIQKMASTLFEIKRDDSRKD
ncbi:hypothetical protein M409DRAFT_57911 [Zasmidium cellare ATCC 36951]|uniref:Uncharacterized protein n=1 Tax=Zasmidium cellare ATCC 36951 TaxID=1080233 RepID=A0A6A6C7M3_ZASCE|nr:uncharacterized protein M409DRAFT_57911 [Zasmidium cellare ATCC 36951]KAF2162853.1 hypothetical protein M409DRAFT_57911 [Zasmidium cellare ATCC 36951]